MHKYEDHGDVTFDEEHSPRRDKPGTGVSNPKDKVGRGKPPLSLLPVVAQIWGSLGMAEGARKYGEKNYRYARINASVYTSAIRRHLAKWEEGEERDPETLVRHLGSVIAGASILLDAQFYGTMVDDRHVTAGNDLANLFDEGQAVIDHLDELYGNDVRPLGER